jgi:hypothetical protein
MERQLKVTAKRKSSKKKTKKVKRPRHPSARTVFEWVGRIALAFAQIEKCLKRLTPLATVDDPIHQLKPWNSFDRKKKLLERHGEALIRRYRYMSNREGRIKRFKAYVALASKYAKERNTRVHAIRREWRIAPDLSVEEVTQLIHHGGNLLVDREGIASLRQLSIELVRVDAQFRGYAYEFGQMVASLSASRDDLPPNNLALVL